MNHNGTNDLPLHIHDDNNGLDYTLQASVTLHQTLWHNHIPALSRY